MITKQELIFKQWAASLVNRDRTRGAIQGNFEDLFLSFKGEGFTLEEAYEYLDKAVKEHLPNLGLVKNAFKKLRLSGKMSNFSEAEFKESWCKDIEKKANTAFFNIFPIEVKQPEPELAVFGNMTAQEYKAQREHAEEYPRLNIEDFQQRMKESDYNPVADISAMLEK